MLTNLSLFSGAGGLDLGARLVGGFKTVAYVEFDPYAQGVLMSRMRSGDLDDAPIFEDVRTFDGRRLRGSVDVISGGFPCQDLSFAGRRAGIDGSRSGLWKEYARIVDEVRPKFVLVENVPGLLADGALGVVLGDLAAMGFDAEWFVLSAGAVGAPHLRERVWIVAYSEDRTSLRRDREFQSAQNPGRSGSDNRGGEAGRFWREESKSRPYGVAYGVEFGSDRIRLCGNGVVPDQSVPAWQKIKDLAKRPRPERRK